MASSPFDERTPALHQPLTGHESLADTLLRISATAVDALGADMAGLTLLDAQGKATTAVFTDEAAPEIDQAQYDADRGPCLDAFRTRQVRRVDDTTSDDRWPEYARCARANEIRSSLSLPLVVDGQGLGALNLYARPLAKFDVNSEAFGLAFADQAAIAVVNGIAYWEKVTLSEHLQTAMESRAVIEQAKGIIMASAGCSADQAFKILRDQSQAENVKLRDIAADLVRRQLRR
jgi:GAF domain-containing protein